MQQYAYDSDAPAHTQSYLMPAVLKALTPFPPPRPLFELGCGNGANAKQLATLGYQVIGVDTSQAGIAQAQDGISTFEVASAYDDLAARFGTFDVVLSLEVVEHLEQPRAYARTIEALLRPNGVAIISTPYHGYFKNLALAVTGKMDAHHGPLWDGGHIKFWNRPYLASLFEEVAMKEVEFFRVGRIPQLAKSMIGVYRKA